ncbi:hypothetical protein [Deinococcus humi]|uniref:Uncharacterized protein n=1 Tax=Deinococcus humi TaxID=662880 RepID=A0A7W8JWS0_9DEIO|nr:hypothetical protein [Deinococcus humi]MBB5364640.1 hypothetical protein [Deinococcus humi]GGO39057.1 hypothetical protein GCM10008949_46600 [Deinococcus humi]
MPSSDYGGDTWGGNLSFERLFTEEAQVVDLDATMEVTLVPEGPLIDGSKGSTTTRTTQVTRGLSDIPVGYYKVSAALKYANGTKTPLRVCQTNTEQALGSTTMMLFREFDTCGHSGTLRQTPIWLLKP